MTTCTTTRSPTRKPEAAGSNCTRAGPVGGVRPDAGTWFDYRLAGGSALWRRGVLLKRRLGRGLLATGLSGRRFDRPANGRRLDRPADSRRFDRPTNRRAGGAGPVVTGHRPLLVLNLPPVFGLAVGFLLCIQEVAQAAGGAFCGFFFLVSLFGVIQTVFLVHALLLPLLTVF